MGNSNSSNSFLIRACRNAGFFVCFNTLICYICVLLKKYKILAFITLFKKHRKNGILFNGEGQQKLAKQLGISYNSYKKYRDYCIDNQLLTSYGPHKQFIKLTRCFSILGIDINKYHIFFSWKNYKTLSLESIYQQLVEEKLMLNFKQQQFKIDKKKQKLHSLKSIENSKHSEPSKVKSLLREFGSVKQGISSISKGMVEYVVTGKNHASNIIGCSPATAKNILRRMHRKQKITRTVINQEMKNIPFSMEGFEILKDSKKQGIIIPSPSKKTFFLSLGSRIVLNAKGSLCRNKS